MWMAQLKTGSELIAILMGASSNLWPIEDVGKAFNQAPDSEKRWQSSKHKWSHVGHTPTIASYLEVSQMHCELETGGTVR